MRAIDAKNIVVLVVAMFVVTGLVPSASPQPTMVNGDPFQLVATRSGPQLFLQVSVRFPRSR